MSAPASLVKLLEPWSHAYGDSKVLPTVVVFVHIAALVFGGGYAVTLDRFTLRAYGGDADARRRQLEALTVSHRLVLSGLAFSAISGVLLFAADIETYWTSAIWWTKAALIVLLLLNGYGITKLEAQLRAGQGDAEGAWRGLRRTAIASLVLWFTIALAGVALVNVG